MSALGVEARRSHELREMWFNPTLPLFYSFYLGLRLEKGWKILCQEQKQMKNIIKK